jgi:NADH:ubiquinone oxidoreductase subunit F (NADH-binding)
MKGKCICALGDFAANPVMGTIKYFRSDYEFTISGTAPSEEQAAEAVASD